MKDKLVSIASSVATSAKSLPRRAASNWLGVVFAASAVLLVFCWRGFVLANRSDQLVDVAAELGSVRQFKDYLYPNKAGTRLIYTQDTEVGPGLYYCNIESGQTALLREIKEEDLDWQRFGMLGWSPDDAFFVYAFPPDAKGRPNESFAFICDGNTGDVVGKVPILPNVSELTWLSPRSFAYMTSYYQVLKVIEQQSDGNWIETRDFGKVFEGPASARKLTATSPTSVAWSDDTSIWTFDLDTRDSETIWEATTNKLLEFTYSREKGEYLLNCADDKGQPFYRFIPRVNGFASVGRIDKPERLVSDVTWDGDQARYAYLSNDCGTTTFYISAKSGSPPIRLPWHGAVRSYLLRGEHLYVTGYLTNKPEMIWDYNLRNQDLRDIAWSAKRDLKHANCVAPVDGMLTNRSGKRVSYHVWRPATVPPGKKCPVIIGQTPNRWWIHFTQIGAIGGYYVALADRSDWFDGLDSWPDDVMALYNVLAKDPNVNTNKVFLYGCSAETAMFNILLAENPRLWTGIITFSPSRLPDLADSHLSSMLIVAGKDDEITKERLPKYLDEAARSGVRVRLDLQGGVRHISKSMATERGRAEQFAKFLTEN